MNEQRLLSWLEPTTAPETLLDETQGLIQRCLQGDEAAYVALYQKHAALIYRLAYGLLQHREDAEEVLQDSFEYAFRRLDNFDPQKSAFTTWLYRIAVSRCRNKRRRKWLPTISLGQLPAQDVPDNENPAPDHLFHLDERQKAVWQALGQLSPKLRETAILRYYYGLQYAEIGEILDVPTKTAESRMRLAHKALREILQESDLLTPGETSDGG